MVIVNVLLIIVSVLLVCVVLIQNSKGGGIMSSRYEMGVARTTDFVEKATWSLAGALVVLCIVLSALLPKNVAQESHSLFEENAPAVQMNIPSDVPTAEDLQK
ncbi:MAG: preprotein translocase subunit SecG [Bacteroidales bacterium]|nr:preprotein translocase subunit SecG [Bacteroidales bacterium]